jgi:putative drug exporter of the RND superfamily
MLDSLGRFIYRTRWAVVIVWLVIFAGAAYFAPRVTSVLHVGGYSIGNSQSVSAYNTLNRAFGYRALLFNIVFTGREDRLLPAADAFRRAAQAHFGHALEVRPPVWTSDHRVIFERIFSIPREDFGASYADYLKQLLPGGPVHGRLAGPSAIYRDMEVVSNEDLRSVEIVTLPIAAVVLLLIFGSVVASALPVLMAPISVTMALATIYLVGHRVDMSIFVLNTASMLGLGIAIDYSLFMVNRFREEIGLGRPLEIAVGRTLATSGRAILVSALVVSVGFLALTLSGVSMLRSLGIGGSIVTVYSLLAALTLQPALLGILGSRINRLPVVPWRLAPRHFWRRGSLWVMRHPIAIIGFVIASIAVLVLPVTHLRVGIPGPEILPPSVDSRAGNDILNRHLGYANFSPVLVVVKRGAHAAPSTFHSTAFILLDRICSSNAVVGVADVPYPVSGRQLRTCGQALRMLQDNSAGLTSHAPARAVQQRVALIAVFLRDDPSSAAAERYVTALSSQPPIPGYSVFVGGQTSAQLDFDAFLYARVPLVVVFVVLTIFVVLSFAFRSVLLPLKAVLMNVFSVLAAYGAVVFAFQDGHFSNLLGFTPVGNIDSIVPVFLFCVLFGISTDYEVFLLSRVQEKYMTTGSNEDSVATGLEHTGRIITSAAVVMIVVFGAFSFARLVVIKEIGLGLAVGVLVDATLIRALLVPATMKLLGRWNWWLPGRGFPEIHKIEEPVDGRKSPAAG